MPITDDEFRAEYDRLAHAVQTGVAFVLGEHDDRAVNQALGSASPKHLRTGVNLRAVDHGSLAELLIHTGVISIEDYRQALLDGLRREVARYEAELTAVHNVEVKLA